MTLRQILLTQRGREKVIRGKWEMVRVLSAYMVAPYSESVAFSDIKLPIDPIDRKKEEKRKAGRRMVLDREAIREEYRKAGMIIEESMIDKILSRRVYKDGETGSSK